MIIPVTVPAERVVGHESLLAERKVGPLHIVRQISVVMVGSVEAEKIRINIMPRYKEMNAHRSMESYQVQST